jgi:LacI family transcriptional regulator
LSAKKPTIDDVAAMAGVARVTVSRVLNGNPNVRDEVRERVQRAVDLLQYKVNMQARFLAGGRSKVLALVYESDVEAEPNSFYQSGLELGALRACTELGFQLLMQAVNQDHSGKNAAGQAAKILELIDANRCDGLILTPPFADNVALLQEIAERRFPLVCISGGAASQALASGVRIDDEVAGYEISRHLLDLGHRRFGFIRGIIGHVSADERYSGFRRALAEAGLGDEAFVAARGNFTFRSGVELTPGLLSDPLDPSAIICANDDMAVGAMFSAHKMGLAIPQDISIVGFDDTPVSEIVWPPLTTVNQPLKTIGYRAASLLVDRITHPKPDQPVQTEIIAHKVVARDSACAPAPRSR